MFKKIWNWIASTVTALKPKKVARTSKVTDYAHMHLPISLIDDEVTYPCYSDIVNEAKTVERRERIHVITNTILPDYDHSTNTPDMQATEIYPESAELHAENLEDILEAFEESPQKAFELHLSMISRKQERVQRARFQEWKTTYDDYDKLRHKLLPKSPIVVDAREELIPELALLS